MGDRFYIKALDISDSFRLVESHVDCYYLYRRWEHIHSQLVAESAKNNAFANAARAIRLLEEAEP